jgi:hypothetical protein
MWECESECDTSNNRSNWNHLKILQKIPEQNTGKARNQSKGKSDRLGEGEYRFALS